MSRYNVWGFAPKGKNMQTQITWLSIIIVLLNIHIISFGVVNPIFSDTHICRISSRICGIFVGFVSLWHRKTQADYIPIKETWQHTNFICCFDVFRLVFVTMSLCLPPAGTIQWIGLQAHRAQEVDRPLTFLMGNPWKSSKKYGNLCGKDAERMWTLRSQAWINLDEVWRPSTGNRKGWWLEMITNYWSMMLIYTPDMYNGCYMVLQPVPTISPIV